MPDMLLYRRHEGTCPFRERGVEYFKCKCPIYCDGALNGRRVRRSMKTRDWQRAQRRLAQLQDPDAQIDITMAEAIEIYLKDCRARKLAGSTLISYTNTLRDLDAFLNHRKTPLLRDLNLEALSAFRASRRGRDGIEGMTAASLRKESVTLRAFCAFAVAAGWSRENAARKLRPPRSGSSPAMPFTREETRLLFEACNKMQNDNEASAGRARTRARALLLTFLYSGLRISDVAKLERASLDLETGRLLLRVMKTGVPLYLRLSRSTVEALRALPVESERYFFWSGRGNLSSAIGSIRRTVDCLMRIAGIKGHPHRFRDTFAVELLKNGQSIRTVQQLLGHASVRTTELHYAPWDASQQKILDEATSTLGYGDPAA